MAENADDLALLDLEADIVERPEMAGGHFLLVAAESARNLGGKPRHTAYIA
jgi:hypothetical protein